MEGTEYIEINTEDLLDETVNNELIDINTNQMGKSVANEYTEIGYYNDIPDNANNSNSSSIVPLCITVVLCFAAGIALGILMAKRAANK